MKRSYKVREIIEVNDYDEGIELTMSGSEFKGAVQEMQIPSERIKLILISVGLKNVGELLGKSLLIEYTEEETKINYDTARFMVIPQPIFC